MIKILLNGIIVFIVITLISGCSRASPIVKVSESKSYFQDAVYEGQDFYIAEKSLAGEQYRIFHQASTGFSGTSGIRRSAMNRANEFCSKLNKKVNVVSEHTAKPPYILGNFPRIEIIFVCQELTKGIESSNKEKYNNLTSLKKLLDEGILTQKEFENEKRKILSEI